MALFELRGITKAFGDHQVANITADNIARTLGIPVYEPVLPDGVIEEELSERFYDLDAIDQFPYAGSALFYWYSGTLDSPLGNITAVMDQECIAACSEEGADEVPPCVDPHEDPRRQPQVVAQKDAFFTPEGLVVNVCDDEPCVAQPRDEFDY